MGHLKRNAFIVILVILVIFLTVYLVAFSISSAQQVAEREAIQNVQLESISAQRTGISLLNGVSLDILMTVYNPDSIPATLDTVSYSVYANGNFLGSGQTNSPQTIDGESSSTMTFPITLSWGSASETVRSSILDGGVSWEIKGVDNVNINGIAFSVPFDFTTSNSKPSPTTTYSQPSPTTTYSQPSPTTTYSDSFSGSNQISITGFSVGVQYSSTGLGNNFPPSASVLNGSVQTSQPEFTVSINFVNNAMARSNTINSVSTSTPGFSVVSVSPNLPSTVPAGGSEILFVTIQGPNSYNGSLSLSLSASASAF